MPSCHSRLVNAREHSLHALKRDYQDDELFRKLSYNCLLYLVEVEDWSKSWTLHRVNLFSTSCFVNEDVALCCCAGQS